MKLKIFEKGAYANHTQEYVYPLKNYFQTVKGKVQIFFTICAIIKEGGDIGLSIILVPKVL